MAEKQQQAYNPAAANGYNRADEERAVAHDKELRDQKRKKWAIYAIIFIVFHVVIIVVSTFTVMKFRTPQFRVRSATFDTFEVQNSNPSFNLKMNTELGVKNTNFGPYKYGNNTIDFFYRGTPIGSAVVPKSKVGFRSTKKFNVGVDLIAPANMAGNSELGSDLRSGVLPLTARSKLNGKVTIMFMFKKNRNIVLDCNMDVNVSTKQLQNVKCR